MATKRQRSNGTWEYRFTRKGVLPSPVYFTFDTEEEGDRYARRAEELLNRGVVPAEMAGGKALDLQSIFDQYELSGSATKSDEAMFIVVGKTVGSTKLKDFDYTWVEEWVQAMVAEKKAPSTLKKRVEFVARSIDWAMRRGLLKLAANPVKLLPKGYATRDVPKERLWAGERDRRLEGAEEWAIRKLLSKDEALLFDLALETAMRLREMFTLNVAQIDLLQRTIFLDKTKNGSKRQVPISSKLLEILRENLPSEGFVLPFWDGSEPVENVTNRLSHLFATRFAKAGCPDLRFHDLRHEAVSRLFERTRLTDTEIASISGHRDPRMLKRYANLRGSTLADKMW